MVAVLFLVGEGKEAPSVVSDLLNLVQTPARPNYEMASDAPLLLYDIGYKSLPGWTADPAAAGAIGEMWADQQRALLLRAGMMHTMRASLPEPIEAAPSDRPPPKNKKGDGSYVPLAQRPTHDSVEAKTKGRAK